MQQDTARPSRLHNARACIAPAHTKTGPILRARKGPAFEILLIEEAAHFAAAAWMLELAQRFGLNLANTFTRHAELLPDFFKRVVGVHSNTEPHTQYAFFTRGERCQNAGHCFLQIGLNRGIHWYDCVFVFDEVTQMAVEEGLVRNFVPSFLNIVDLYLHISESNCAIVRY